MNGKDLFQAVGFIEDGMVEAAQRRKAPVWYKWVSAAACIGIILGSLLLWGFPADKSAMPEHLGVQDGQSNLEMVEETNKSTQPEKSSPRTLILRVVSAAPDSLIAEVEEGEYGSLTKGTRVKVCIRANLSFGESCAPGERICVEIESFDEEALTLYAQTIHHQG